MYGCTHWSCDYYGARLRHSTAYMLHLFVQPTTNYLIFRVQYLFHAFKKNRNQQPRVSKHPKPRVLPHPFTNKTIESKYYTQYQKLYTLYTARAHSFLLYKTNKAHSSLYSPPSSSLINDIAARALQWVSSLRHWRSVRVSAAENVSEIASFVRRCVESSNVGHRASFCFVCYLDSLWLRCLRVRVYVCVCCVVMSWIKRTLVAFCAAVIPEVIPYPYPHLHIKPDPSPVKPHFSGEATRLVGGVFFGYGDMRENASGRQYIARVNARIARKRNQLTVASHIYIYSLRSSNEL